MRERANQQSGQECCCCERMLNAVVALILTVKKKWLTTIWNRNLRDCIFVSICPHCALDVFGTGNAPSVEVKTNWKSLQCFIFCVPEKVIKLAKNKIRKIEENLNESVKHCLK